MYYYLLKQVISILYKILLFLNKITHFYPQPMLIKLMNFIRKLNKNNEHKLNIQSLPFVNHLVPL
jgi:hypothetical protein